MSEFLVKPIAFLSALLMIPVVYFMDLLIISPTIDAFFPIGDISFGYMNILAKLFSWVLYIIAIFMIAYLAITKEEM